MKYERMLFFIITELKREALTVNYYRLTSPSKNLDKTGLRKNENFQVTDICPGASKEKKFKNLLTPSLENKNIALLFFLLLKGAKDKLTFKKVCASIFSRS